jgi:hypothetical protein
MRTPSRGDVGSVLRALPPAPAAWVACAEELPRVERALAALDEQPYGVPETVALQRALRGVGLEPTDDRVRALVRFRDRTFTT